MAWPDQPDPIDDRAREAVADYLRPFETENPAAMLEGIDEVSTRLGRLGGKVIPALAEALGRAHLGARVAAAWFLSFLNEQRPGLVRPVYADGAADILVQALREGDAESRIWPLVFLGSWGGVPAAAVPVLRTMVADADRRVRVGAAAALCHFGAARAALPAAEVEWDELLKVLGDAMFSADEPTALLAATALGRLGVRALAPVDALAGAVGRVSPTLLPAVVQALGLSHRLTRRAVEALSGLLADGGVAPAVRSAAAKSLVQLTRDAGGAAAIAVQAFRDGDLPVFSGAVEGLVSRPEFPPEVAAILAGMLEAEEVEARGMAAWWLSQNESAATRAIPALVGRLGMEPDAGALQAVLKALVS